MKFELFLMRTLFVLVAIAGVTAMGGMLRSDVTSAQKIAQTHTQSASPHAG